jgi:hypothetical protein
LVMIFVVNSDSQHYLRTGILWRPEFWVFWLCVSPSQMHSGIYAWFPVYTSFNPYCYIVSVKVQFFCLPIGQNRITCRSTKRRVHCVLCRGGNRSTMKH